MYALNQLQYNIISDLFSDNLTCQYGPDKRYNFDIRYCYEISLHFCMGFGKARRNTMKKLIKNNVYWVGKIDWELESFHGADYFINHGSSQNAYLITEQCIRQNKVTAAICGATAALAQNGLLDTRRHTSNDLGYLKMVCPGYRGEKYYKNEPAVTDGKLITAAGVAPLEFAVHVLKALDVFSPATLDAWYQLNKTHGAEHFYELMQSIQ